MKTAIIFRISLIVIPVVLAVFVAWQFLGTLAGSLAGPICPRSAITDLESSPLPRDPQKELLIEDLPPRYFAAVRFRTEVYATASADRASVLDDAPKMCRGFVLLEDGERNGLFHVATIYRKSGKFVARFDMSGYVKKSDLEPLGLLQ